MAMKQFLALLLSLACGSVFAQTCTTTISAGDNVLGPAISSAAAGSVICLNSGTYTHNSNGGVAVAQVRPASRVTIRSVSGTKETSGAFIAMKEIYRSTNITFKDVRMSGVRISDFGSSPFNSNLAFIGVDFTGVILVDRGGSSSSNNATGDILFYDIRVATPYNTNSAESEVGMLYLTCQPSCNGAVDSGVRLEHSLFDGTGTCDDAIQITGGHKGARIGPGNIFRNWTQLSDGVHGTCGPHVDAFQTVGCCSTIVEGNYYTNNTINIGLYDGADDMIFRNNIYNGQADASVQTFQIGNVDGMLFSHNTLRAIVNTSIGTKAGNPVNTNWIIENNVLVSGTQLASGGDQPGCGSNCIKRYNLISSDSALSVTGGTSSNNITGTASFVGGSSPSTWGGWFLNSGSPGKAAGNDGKDMGTLFRNPAAPANFQ